MIKKFFKAGRQNQLERRARQQSQLKKKKSKKLLLALESHESQGLPSGSVDKNLSVKAEDTGSIPEPGRSHMPQGN